MKRFYYSIGLFLLLTTIGCAGQRKAVVVQPTRGSNHERVYFDFNKSKIRNQDRPVLNGVASRLQTDKKTMAIVEGHTDQIGSVRYNEALAEDRARAVRVYLRDQGADPQRVTVVSKGKREPLVKGRGRKQLEQNRSVEILMGLTGREER